MDRLEQIKGEIAELEKELGVLAKKYHQTYSEYLKDLGEAVRQGIIMASYNICTQGYPEQFMRVSLSGRQKLQQSIRQVGSLAQEQLLAQLDRSEDRVGEKVEETKVEAFLPSILQKTPETLFSPAKILPQDEGQPSGKNDIQGSKSNGGGIDQTKHFTNPEELARWQEKLEKAIASILETVSRQTNHLLRQGKILPTHQLPESILEAAKSARASDSVAAGAPNIINLLIEAEGPGSAEGSAEYSEPMEEKVRKPIAIMEIYLRLSELEFGDGAVNSGRQKIRNLKGQLQTLGRKYQKKQRERVVALAEAAWRSSWFED